MSALPMTIAALTMLKDTHKRKVVVSGRQWGKSWLGIRMLSEYLEKTQKPEPKHLSGRYPK